MSYKSKNFKKVTELKHFRVNYRTIKSDNQTRKTAFITKTAVILQSKIHVYAAL